MWAGLAREGRRGWDSGMISPLAARRIWPFVRAWAQRGAVLVVVLGFAACAGPARKSAPAALVQVENHSGYAWQVDFFNRETAAKDAVASAQLGPRERRRLALAPGVYRVRSRVAGAGETERVWVPPGADAEVELQGGRTYVWPLGTLLSVETPGS